MSAKKKKPSVVREPIQVYLDGDERRQLDTLARQLSVSRAEVLRRGLESLRRESAPGVYARFAPLIGSMDAPEVPTDASASFKQHYADVLEEKWKRGKRSS